MSALRPIVITPYYKEDPATIRRCMGSVRSQTVPAEHLLVADGHPQDWIDREPVRHLRLDRAHADAGNTPRGLGALLAAQEGFTAIMMLDADNWLEPEHVEVCLRAAAAKPDTDFVVAKRQFRRLDGSVMPIRDESLDTHVDTNCFVYLPGAFHLLGIWLLMPRPMAPTGDRLIWSIVRTRQLSGVVLDGPVTVNYQCMWESLYRAVGETPPPGAKPNDDLRPVREWLANLGDREREVLTRLVGVNLQSPRNGQ
jgi:hypothetical protein